MNESEIPCDVCGSDIRGYSNLKDGRLLCSPCLNRETESFAQCQQLLQDGVVAAEGALVLADAFFDRDNRDPCNSDNYCRLTDWIKKAKRGTIDNSPTSCGFGTAQPACILGVNKDPQPCVWKQDDDGNWFTECNNGFWFDSEEGPLANKMRFCCYCGHPLAEKPYVEPTTEDEP